MLCNLQRSLTLLNSFTGWPTLILLMGVRVGFNLLPHGLVAEPPSQLSKDPHEAADTICTQQVPATCLAHDN